MTSRNLLRCQNIFSGLSDEDLRRLSPFFREQRFARDAVICKEDAEADSLYLLLEGRVALRFHTGAHPNSRELTLDVLGPGEVMGWSALVPPRRLTASGVCLEPVHVLVASGTDLHALLEKDPCLGYRIISRLAEVIAVRLRDSRMELAQEICRTQD